MTIKKEMIALEESLHTLEQWQEFGRGKTEYTMITVIDLKSLLLNQMRQKGFFLTLKKN